MSELFDVDRTLIHGQAPFWGDFTPRDRQNPNLLAAPGPVPLYLIPSWIFDLFVTKHNLVDIRHYGKLRQVVSVNDVAQMEVLRRRFEVQIDNLVLNQWDFQPLHPAFTVFHFTGGQNAESLTEDEANEIQTTLKFLVDDTSFGDCVMQRFRGYQEADQDIDSDSVWSSKSCQGSFENNQKNPFQVIANPGCVYIKVEEGIFSYLEKKEQLLTFLSEVLKSAYAISPLSVVNQGLIYQAYVKTLA